MVARTQNFRDLIVTFQRDGEQPERMIARNPANAWEHGIYLLSQRQELRHGDTLTVRRTDEDQSATVLQGTRSKETPPTISERRRPDHTVPCLAVPGLTVPRRAMPNPTPPSPTEPCHDKPLARPDQPVADRDFNKKHDTHDHDVQAQILPYLHFATRMEIRQAVARGEMAEREAHELMRSYVLPTRPIPVVGRLGSAYIPAIYDPTVSTEWLRFERFRRKAKASYAEAWDYAQRVLWYRHVRAAEKRRRLEAISHPRHEGRAA